MPPSEDPSGEPPVQLAEPHAALGRFVARYSAVSIDVPAGEVVASRMSASIYPIVFLLWSGEVVIPGLRGSDVRLEPAMAVGPVPRWRDHHYTGPVRAFVIHFRGGGAHALLGIRCGGLDDWAEPLDRVADPDAAPAIAAWRTETVGAASFAERVAAADRFLRARAPAAPAADEVDTAAAEIEASCGMLRVGGLGAGVSERTFRRRFIDRHGIAPKLYARLVRFRYCHAFLTAEPGATWAEAVVRFGYADQAHLVREFREFAGAPPTRYHEAVRAIDRTATP